MSFTAYQLGMQRSIPLVFSASFFGLIFGFTGASGQLPLGLVSAMSYIIFAGSAQFIALVLIIQEQQLVAIVITAIILNLRHLLYGGVLHELLDFGSWRKLIPAYFLTDESFLVTTIVHRESQQENRQIQLDWVLLGAGTTLWLFWNLSTILGYLLFTVAENLVILPNNFVIAASFIGFLVEHWVRYPSDRIVMVGCGVLAIGLGWVASSSVILITVMIAGAIIGMIQLYWEGSHV